MADHIHRQLEIVEKTGKFEYGEQFFTSKGSKGGKYTGDYSDFCAYLDVLFDDYEATYLKPLAEIEKIAKCLIIHDMRHLIKYTYDKCRQWKFFGFVPSYYDYEYEVIPDENGFRDFDWRKYDPTTRTWKCSLCKDERVRNFACQEMYESCINYVGSPWRRWDPECWRDEWNYLKGIPEKNYSAHFYTGNDEKCLARWPDRIVRSDSGDWPVDSLHGVRFGKTKEELDAEEQKAKKG
jgi:hypothetical protein